MCYFFTHPSTSNNLSNNSKLCVFFQTKACYSWTKLDTLVRKDTPNFVGVCGTVRVSSHTLYDRLLESSCLSPVPVGISTEMATYYMYLFCMYTRIIKRISAMIIQTTIKIIVPKLYWARIEKRKMIVMLPNTNVSQHLPRLNITLQILRMR